MLLVCCFCDKVRDAMCHPSEGPWQDLQVYMVRNPKRAVIHARSLSEEGRASQAYPFLA
jgi:hypothetical protein